MSSYNSSVWNEEYFEECIEGVAREPHPFDDVTLITPYLDQGKYWCDKDRKYLEIDDMEPAHALNAVRLLLKKAPDIYFMIHFTTAAVDLQAYILSYSLAQALIARAKSAKETRYPWDQVSKRKKKK